MLNRRETAWKLAREHYRVDDGIVRVFRLVSPHEAESEPIKLLEVNRFTIPAGIMPLRFAAVPAQGVPFPSVIVEVTPAEFELIQSSHLPLPQDWRIEEEIPNEAPGPNGS